MTGFQVPRKRFDDSHSLKPKNFYSDKGSPSKLEASDKTKPKRWQQTRFVKKANSKTLLVNIPGLDGPYDNFNFQSEPISKRRVKAIQKGIKSTMRCTPKAIVKGIAKCSAVGLGNGAVAGGVIGFIGGGPVGGALGASVCSVVGGVGGLIGGVLKYFYGSTQIHMPHNQRWFHQLLGREAIGILLNDAPAPHELDIVNTAIRNAPEKMQDILNDPNCINDPIKIGFYMNQFQQFHSSVDIYLEEAENRMMGGQQIWDNFMLLSKTNEKAANKQLRDDVAYLLTTFRNNKSKVAEGTLITLSEIMYKNRPHDTDVNSLRQIIMNNLH